MPEEIADSDAESDYENSPSRRPALSSIVAANSGPEADPADDSYRPFEIDFNQFVTQSSTSQNSIPQNDPSKRSTGSTDKLLRGIGDAQHDLAGSSSTKTLSVYKNQHTQPNLSPDLHSPPTPSQINSDISGPLTGAQLDGSPTEISRKRRHTEAQWTSDQIEHPKKNKRAKTHGNSRVQAVSSPNDLFAAQPDSSLIPDAEDPGENTASWPDASRVIPHVERSLMPPPPADWNDDDGDDEVIVRQRPKPRRVISLLDANTTDPSGEISMTRSSMGGYQSINLDFRGSTHSLAIDTNPFGEPSQISVDDNVNPAGTQKLSNGPLNDATLAKALPGFHNPPDSIIIQQTSGENTALHSTDVTSSRSRSIDPTMLFTHLPDDLPHDTQLLSSSPGASSLKRRKTYHDGTDPITLLPDSWVEDKSMHKVADDSRKTAIVPKKRGRKPKNQRSSSTSPAPTGNRRDDADEHEAALDSSRKQQKSRPTRSRVSTTEFDTSDQQPEQDADRANKKGKRKVSRANNNTINTSQGTASASPAKQLSSELKLSDEAFIGLPKESYNPRPSRSRRGTTDSVDEDPKLASDVQTDKKKKNRLEGESKGDHIETTNDESSPIKLPTSALNLSEEVAIGLPKENYKPRPSRSRSTRIIDEDEASVEQVRDKTPQEAETREGDHSPATKKKKGKKAKVKRAKTSAAALLKSQQMFSDGEDDVIFMDEKPSKVKLDLPPEIKLGKTLKQENGEEIGEAEETFRLRGDGADDIGVEDHPDNPQSKILESKVAKTNFTIELPPPPDTAKEPPKPEPKKRGRKRKKPIEEPPEEAVDEASSSEAKSRPALKDRDPNQQPRSALNDPTRRSEPASTPSPQKEKARDKENVLESTAVTTPLKPFKETSPTKGPTKHSPINPPGTKAIYRVGLSRRVPIPSLLKMVRKDRPAPAPQPKRGKKKTKDVDVDVDTEAEISQLHVAGEDDDYHEHQRRDADGMGAMRRNPETGLLEEYISD